ncbi:MAG TPA: putative metal-dependent hydrolase [bacterium]|nr:putative metal-dependent hydrolase [bacterium]
MGKAVIDPSPTPQKRAAWIGDIADLPGKARAAVAGLTQAQLDTPYRDGGWTVRQVVHHLADSHMNSFVRFKLALTEASPTIKAYDEKLWALTADAGLDVASSLALLEGLHTRWAALLSNLAPEQWERTFVHPESGVQKLDRTLQVYAWHCKHHVAHITALRARSGWR